MKFLINGQKKSEDIDEQTMRTMLTESKDILDECFKHNVSERARLSESAVKCSLFGFQSISYDGVTITPTSYSVRYNYGPMRPMFGIYNWTMTTRTYDPSTIGLEDARNEVIRLLAVKDLFKFINKQRYQINIVSKDNTWFNIVNYTPIEHVCPKCLRHVKTTNMDYHQKSKICKTNTAKVDANVGGFVQTEDAKLINAMKRVNLPFKEVPRKIDFYIPKWISDGYKLYRKNDGFGMILDDYLKGLTAPSEENNGIS